MADGEDTKTGLKKTLGLTALTFTAVGMILGAGIYSVIGAAAGEAGHAIWMSFALAGVTALLTGLSYAELTASLPKAGAEFQFLRRAFPKADWTATIVGTVLVFGACATAATVATAFAGYLSTFVDVPLLPTAIGLLVLMTGLNMLGIRESTWMNIAFTCVEVSGLILVICLGAPEIDASKLMDAKSATGVLAGTALVFFAYLGFEDIANLAEETKDPGKTIPRAILISVLVTTILYVAVALTATALIPAEELAASKSPLATAAAAKSSWAPRALGAAALFATSNTALITLMASSRVLFGMAREKHLPSPLAKLSGRKTPWVGALVVFGVALALLPMGKVSGLAGLSSFSALIAFATVHVTLIVLRVKEPRMKRPFRVPLAIGKIPVLPVLGALLAAVLLTRFDGAVYFVGAIVLVAAVAIALMRPWFRKPRG